MLYRSDPRVGLTFLALTYLGKPGKPPPEKIGGA